MMLLVIMCSSILQVMDVSEMGRYLLGCRRSLSYHVHGQGLEDVGGLS